MAKGTQNGPKPDKLPLDKMPVEKLAEVLPQDSDLLQAVAPGSHQTGVASGWTITSGNEPYLYDATTFRMMAELGSGTDSGYISSLAAFNGDLYVAGWGDGGSGANYYWYGVLARWDPETGTLTHLQGSSELTSSYLNSMKVANGDIYFLSHDSSDVAHLGYIEGTDDTVHYITIPTHLAQNVGTSEMLQHGDTLILLNPEYARGTGKDILLYDTVTSSWTAYDVPNNGGVASGLVVGNDLFFWGYTGSWTSGLTSQSLYKMDLQTGQIVIALADNWSGTGAEGSYYQAYAKLGEDYYFPGYSPVAGVQSIVHIDGDTGTASTISILQTQYSYISALASSSNAAYFAVADWTGTGYVTDIVKLSKDVNGSEIVKTFDLNLPGQGLVSLFVYNGQLYFTNDPNNGDADLLRLNEQTQSIEFVAEFGSSSTYSAILPLGVVDGYLAVMADTDRNGAYELWTSADPTNGASWQMISGDVPVSTGYFTTILQGDYLL